MIKYLNENAKQPYYYIQYWVDEITDERLYNICKKHATLTTKQRKTGRDGANYITTMTPSKTIGRGRYRKTILNVPMSFDIETTTTYQKDDNGKLIKAFATMYIWQFGIGNVVIMGNTWQEFVTLLGKIKNVYKPNDYTRVIVWVHNLSYESQFMRKWLNVTDSFLKEQRHFITLEHDSFIQFRDSMAMTNSSLERLAKDYTNTQKCKGDLDYSIERNRNTRLTRQELSYCHNDVLILTEFATYFYNQYISTGYLPLTISATVRKSIKDAMSDEEIERERYKIPQEEYLYNLITHNVYRGGYAHADESIVGELFDENDNIYGWDFTSSYPSVILLCYMPGKFRRVNKPSKADFERLLKYKCCIFTITFYDIKSTSNHSIESKHKCIELIEPKLDNGHVRSAKRMTVSLCELDFETYKEYYQWSFYTIQELYIADRIQTPHFIIEPMSKDYTAKAVNKAQGLNYALEKVRVNTYYGVLVTRRNVESVKYTNDGWVNGDVDDYAKWRDKQHVVAQYGCYVSAHARRNLLKVAYKIINNPNNYTPVLYCDTDSLKVAYTDDYVKNVIDEYNRELSTRLDIAIKKYNLDREIFGDLGMFDEEYNGNVKAFKTLGAKRYLMTYEKDGELKHLQTVAGLPKGILFKNVSRETFLKVYDEFEDGMYVECCKLMSVYIDEPSEEYIDGVLQCELSSVALVPTDFTMSLNDLWKQALLLMYDKTKDERKVIK